MRERPRVRGNDHCVCFFKRVRMSDRCFKQTEFFELGFLAQKLSSLNSFSALTNRVQRTRFLARKPSSKNSVCLKLLSLILARLKKHTLIISLSLSVSLSLSDSPQSQSLSHSRSHSLTLLRRRHCRRCRRFVAIAISLTHLP